MAATIRVLLNTMTPERGEDDRKVWAGHASHLLYSLGIHEIISSILRQA
jgi:hypothetical protein